MPDFGVIYLDVAIGLAVAFLILSLVPSGLSEAAAFLTRIRSKFLWAYLNQLFTAAVPAGAEHSAGRASARAVAPGGAAATGPAQPGEPEATGLPSSGRELRHLMRARGAADPRPGLAPAGDGAPFVARLHRQLGPISVQPALPQLRDTPSKRTTTKHIPPRSLAQAVVEVVAGVDPDDPDAISERIDELRGTPIHPTLTTMWAAAERDLARFRDRLEGWFDAEMARLSGLYKRISRFLLAGAAVLVALVANVDPIALGKDLWRDPERRAVFVDLADDASADASSDPDVDRELSVLFEACRGDVGEGDVTVEEAAQRVESLRSCVVDSLDSQRELGLLNDSLFEPKEFGDSWSGDLQWLTRPFKLAAVAAAIFFGAPFWYDVVRRLMGVRKGAIKQET